MTPKPVEGPERVTTAEAARRLGMTRQGAGQWAAKPDAPVVREAGVVWFLWPDFPRWRDAEMRASAQGALDEARTRKTLAEAERAELELAQVRGSLITVDDAVQRASVVFDGLRARILAARPRLAAAVVGATTIREADQRVEPVIAELLESLSGAWPR